MKMEIKNMKEIGKKINQMVKEYYIMKMGIKNMKEIGKKVNQVENGKLYYESK